MVLSTNSCAISEHKRYIDDGGGQSHSNKTLIPTSDTMPSTGTACESTYHHSCRLRKVCISMVSSSELRLSDVSRKYKVPSIHFLQCSLHSPEAFLPAAVFQCSGLLHFRKSHSGIVFLASPSNVRRQQNPAPTKSFFVENLSAVHLPLNLKLVTPIPSPAQNSTPMLEKSLKGLENIHSKVQSYISAYICYLQARFINIFSITSIILHTCGFRSNEDIKISSNIFIQVAFAWERVIRMRFHQFSCIF